MPLVDYQHTDCGAVGCPMDAVTAQAKALDARNRELHRALAVAVAERDVALAEANQLRQRVQSLLANSWRVRPGNARDSPEE